LIEMGALLNEKDNRGNTPLHNTATGTSANVTAEGIKSIQLLVDAGALTQEKNNNGLTPYELSYRRQVITRDGRLYPYHVRITRFLEYYPLIAARQRLMSSRLFESRLIPDRYRGAHAPDPSHYLSFDPTRSARPQVYLPLQSIIDRYPHEEQESFVRQEVSNTLDRVVENKRPSKKRRTGGRKKKKRTKRKYNR